MDEFPGVWRIYYKIKNYLNVSEVFAKILSKMINPKNINQMEVEIINFRNIDAIKFRVTGDSETETASILVPHIREKSPVLM